MIGSPMGAAGFATLAGHFTDRTIVTYDPRGVERSKRTDVGLEVTPEVHAADVRAVIDAVGRSPLDVFASSGGAVNALALVAANPDLVRTLVAHEPPSVSLLPDANEALAACRTVGETYQRHGWGAGMAHFIAVVSLRGPVPADFATQPGPDPAMFGMPTEDDGTRDDLMLGSNIVTVTSYRPEVDRLRSAPTRIVLAVGAGSEGELAYRGGQAVAELPSVCAGCVSGRSRRFPRRGVRPNGRAGAPSPSVRATSWRTDADSVRATSRSSRPHRGRRDLEARRIAPRIRVVHGAPCHAAARQDAPRDYWTMVQMQPRSAMRLSRPPAYVRFAAGLFASQR